MWPKCGGLCVRDAQTFVLVNIIPYLYYYYSFCTKSYDIAKFKHSLKWNRRKRERKSDVKSHHSLYSIRNHLAMWNSFNTHAHRTRETLSFIWFSWTLFRLCFLVSIYLFCMWPFDYPVNRIFRFWAHTYAFIEFHKLNVSNECNMVWTKYNNEFIIERAAEPEWAACLDWLWCFGKFSTSNSRSAISIINCTQ